MYIYESKPTFIAHEWQHKAQKLIESLLPTWRRTWYSKFADQKPRFALMDNNTHNLAEKTLRGYYKRYKEVDIPVVMYPHAARPPLWWDISGIWEDASLQLATSEGYKEICRRLGANFPIEVVGWYWSEIRPFKPRPKPHVETVLFAPIHPNANRMMAPIDIELNQKAFDLLLKTGCHIIVRHIGSVKENGLWRDKRVIYRQATPDGKIGFDVDVIVGHQSFGYIAAALGLPLVMFGEDTVPHFGVGGYREISNWDEFKEDLMFPLDLFNGPEVLREALYPNKAVEEWKERLIGQPFQKDKLLQAVEKWKN